MNIPSLKIPSLKPPTLSKPVEVVQPPAAPKMPSLKAPSLKAPSIPTPVIIPKGEIKGRTDCCPVCSRRHKLCPNCKTHGKILLTGTIHKVFCKCPIPYEEKCGGFS